MLRKQRLLKHHTHTQTTHTTHKPSTCVRITAVAPPKVLPPHLPCSRSRTPTCTCPTQGPAPPPSRSTLLPPHAAPLNPSPRRRRIGTPFPSWPRPPRDPHPGIQPDQDLPVDPGVVAGQGYRLWPAVVDHHGPRAVEVHTQRAAERDLAAQERLGQGVVDVAVKRGSGRRGKASSM